MVPTRNTASLDLVSNRASARSPHGVLPHKKVLFYIPSCAEATHFVQAREIPTLARRILGSEVNLQT